MRAHLCAVLTTAGNSLTDSVNFYSTIENIADKELQKCKGEKCKKKKPSAHLTKKTNGGVR